MSHVQSLPIREKFAYGLGDAAANLIFQSQITFLLFFYTDVLSLAAGVAGQVLLISRVVDALTDPVMGALADRTDTRWGRYRPWVLLTSVPLAAFFVLCFTAPDISAQGKLLWAIGTYNALMIVYAANNIPYSALAGVMTGDPMERTSLLSWRFVFAMTAALAVNVLTDKLVDVLGGGNKERGFQLTMGLWGTLAVLLFCMTFVGTRERIRPASRTRSVVWQDLTDLFRSGPWIVLFTSGLLIHIQLALRSGSLLYYFNYFHTSPPLLDAVTNFGLFNGIGLASAIVGVMLSKPLAARFGKRRTLQFGLFLSAAWMIALAFVPPNALAFLLVVQVFMQLSFGPTIPILWSMMADVADFSEWRTGRASTALAFGSIVFGLKLGFGIGAWINGKLLDYFAYSAGEILAANALSGVVLMTSVLPGVVLLGAAAVMFAYGLDDSLLQRVTTDLNAGRKRE